MEDISIDEDILAEVNAMTDEEKRLEVNRIMTEHEQEKVEARIAKVRTEIPRSPSPLTKTESRIFDNMVKYGCDGDKLHDWIISQRGNNVDLLDMSDKAYGQLINRYSLLPDAEYEYRANESLKNDLIKEFLDRHNVFNPDIPFHIIDQIVKSMKHAIGARGAIMARNQLLGQYEESEREKSIQLMLKKAAEHPRLSAKILAIKPGRYSQVWAEIEKIIKDSKNVHFSRQKPS